MEQANELKVSNQVHNFISSFTDTWWSTSKDFPKLKNTTTYWHKKKQERLTNDFIDKFVKAIKSFPLGNQNQRIWKKNINLLIDNFVANSDLINSEDKNILFSEALLKNTENFVNEAQAFNPDMPIENIGQALRNLWIMNIIQMLFGKLPKLTPSIFSYSMLYPYTDNFLDDNNISKSEKIKMNDTFEKKLAGESVQPISPYERHLFNLVEKIEGEFDRSKNIEVFESLLCIQNAQMKSLIQQGKLTLPYECDILGISMEKGGSSVLADAYIVNGSLTEEEAEFFFGYGVLLQICDDLQDAKEDFKNGHMTIVSQLSTKWPLDHIANCLINFTFDLLNNTKAFNCPNIDLLKELIQKNCLKLILFAITKNKSLYSKKYFKKMKAYFPYTPRYMKNLYKKLKRKYSNNIKESYNGMTTNEIIMYALKPE
ncbi:MULTISPECIES: hypothetical protein [Clostridium]|uniref:hypothetical protein n=1 Tax=Clostridium TaxID=1485 RepID=UPI00069F4EE7|nr:MULTISPECIES: hypothetical protein [Clostridium]KOF56464.1 hypothetical protein AGR56_06670 [Clostridium sp. DMHC 10]MCD2346935.1 hypothetical protein [Clostridium guangxiense]